MSQNSRSHLLIILVFAGLVFLSIGLTSFTVLNINLSGKGDDGGYRNVTMTDAYMQCEEKLKDSVGKALVSYGPDNLSTRFDQQLNSYLIFFNAEIRERSGETAPNFITCEVTSRGYIESFYVSLERSDGDGIDRKEKGNPFGYEF